MMMRLTTMTMVMMMVLIKGLCMARAPRAQTHLAPKAQHAPATDNPYPDDHHHHHPDHDHDHHNDKCTNNKGSKKKDKTKQF